MNNRIFILIFVLAVFILGGVLYINNPDPTEYKNPKERESVACTADAKLCPDGSYVGRSGPNCEFDVCPIPPGAMMEDGTIPEESTDKPDTIPPQACTMDAKLCPDGSYVGRSGPNCEFAKCP